MFCGKHYILVVLFSTVYGAKIFEFRDKRDVGGAKLLNSFDGSSSSSISFCVDFDMKLVKYSRIISTPGSDDLEVVIPESLDRFYTKFKGIWYLTPPLNEIDPYSFGTYCMSYEAIYHHVIFAFNGLIIFEKIDPTLLGPGVLSSDFPNNIVLGEKDNFYTLSGAITRLNVWGKAITKEQLELKSSCDGLDDSTQEVGDPDLLDWETAKWVIYEGIKTKNYSAYPCNSNQKDTIDVLMPYAAETLYDAMDTCSVLGGKMAPPKSEADMRRMLSKTIADVDNSDCSAYLWLPFKKNTENEWALYDGTEESLLPEFFKEPTWLEWLPGQPNGLHLEECAMVKFDSPYVYDVDCIQKNQCYMCEFEDITYFSIRGLCNNLKSSLDLLYLVDMEKVSQNIEKGVVWTGYRKSRIMFDRELNRWKVTSLDDNIPILTLASKEKLPVGPLMWDIPLNICNDDKSERKLFLTSCNETEFACQDGNCIPIQERCDGELQCGDDSDELSCKTLYWAEGGIDAYTQELPPTPYEETVGDKLPILISADIQNVLELKELEGFWQTKVVFDLLWFDQRLLMQNLKEDDHFNILADEERQLIWFPEIIFGNNDEVKRMVLDKKADIIVKREGVGYENDLSDLTAAELFDGFDNPFLYSRTYSTKFECDFNLKSYPFDTQECVIILKVPKAQLGDINITAHNIKYSGPKDLPQFEVESVNTKNSDGEAIFIMKFQRKFSYHLISVYIPSLSLFIISLVTMHIDIEHFEATIMVHLTAMLVVYTLFQAISVSLPKTAYIKLMDVWLLFGLVLPFVSFILTLIEEMIKNKHEKRVEPNELRGMSAKSIMAFENKNTTPSNSGKKRIQFVSRVLLPSVATFFVVVYVFIAIYLYKFPTLEYGI